MNPKSNSSSPRAPRSGGFSSRPSAPRYGGSRFSGGNGGGGSSSRGGYAPRGGYGGGRGGYGGGGGGRGGGGPKSERSDGCRLINKPVITEEVDNFKPEHNFTDFAIDERLKKNILTKGYTAPTPIQDRVIPHILRGE